MDFEKETARLSQNKAVELFTRENQPLDSLIVYGVSADESRSRVFTNSALVGPDDAEYLFSQPALPFLESMGRFTGHWELKAFGYTITSSKRMMTNSSRFGTMAMRNASLNWIKKLKQLGSARGKFANSSTPRKCIWRYTQKYSNSLDVRSTNSGSRKA